jgi:hypothetical protein
MGISRRMGVAISGLAFAGATALTLGAAQPASAQTATVVPQHATAGYSAIDKRRRWSYDYSYSYSWSWGCGCCCCC